MCIRSKASTILGVLLTSYPVKCFFKLKIALPFHLKVGKTIQTYIDLLFQIRNRLVNFNLSSLELLSNVVLGVLGVVKLN